MSKKIAPLSEKVIVDGLRNGDSGVLTALYKEHYKTVLNFILNNNGTHEAARDVYQEAMIVLYENAQKKEFELKCHVQTYLYSVSRRLWLKQLKRNGKMGLLKKNDDFEMVDVGDDMKDHLAKEAEFDKMNASLLQLGEPCSALLKDFYLNKMSMEEITEKFGYTNTDNAKNQKYKCLQRLKKYFFDKTTIEQE